MGTYTMDVASLQNVPQKVEPLKNVTALKISGKLHASIEVPVKKLNSMVLARKQTIPTE
jgi:hypothetical protein